MANKDNERINDFIEAEKAEDNNTSIEVTNLSEKVKKSFLEYAMSVIVARAIPDVRDGMKPVHRRILHGMNEAGMYSNTPHKKSARIVGDVMGKYHPHGDSSIYEAMVRLAQSFSTRYPLVDGHGNFGSIDGDDPAAMRYTEARMTKIAMEMIRDINKDTVDFVPNYDGEDEEPVALPSRFPNVLVNGSTGIAVGMATNMPPHNLGEAIDATLAIYENPDITIPELMEIIPGPDFPTGAQLLGKAGIIKAYETGQGSIVVRSKAEIERLSNGKPRIIITEIPYGVNKAAMIERIGELARDKVIDGLTDIRDESAAEDIRIVIELRKEIVPEVILNQLYKLTQLQINYGINNLVLVYGEPKVLGIKQLLTYYMDYQFDVVSRRIRFDLNKDEERDHILQGLIKAQDNIDEVIHTIRASRESTDALIAVMMEKFDLTEKQVKAVLAMTLRQLQALELEKLVNEHNDLVAEIAYFKEVLADKEKLYQIIKSEMLAIKDKYADKRRTELVAGESSIEDEDLIPREDMLITLSAAGYIKRVNVDTYRAQKRGGKGMKGMSTNEDDVVEKIVKANTHEDVLFFTNTGKVYRLRGHQIPEYSRQSKGIPAINLLKFEQDEKIKSIISFDNKSDDLTDEHCLVFVTKLGVTKRVYLSEFKRINQNGKIALGLREGDELVDVKLTDGTAEILIASSNGKVCRFNESDIRVMGRTAAGVKGIELPDDAIVVGVATSLEGKYILVISEYGYGKMSTIDDYRLTRRGSQGVLTVKTTEKNGNLAKILAVNGDEDAFIVTDSGIIIRTSLKEVKIAGRNTLGVRIIKLSNNQKVSSICTTEASEDEEFETTTDDTNTEVEQVSTESENTEE